MVWLFSIISMSGKLRIWSGFINLFCLFREVEYGREKSHTKHQRSANSDSFKITQLKTGTQHQFWVTASSKKGEGRSSQVVSKTPSMRHSTQITSIGREIFQRWRSQVHLGCSHAGTPTPQTRWFFQGKEATWVNQASLYGRSQLKIDSATPNDSGNYTCVIENGEMLDSISYSLKIQGTFRSNGELIFNRIF